MFDQFDLNTTNLESVQFLPVRAHLYWKSLEGAYLGCNNLMLECLGLSNQEELLGKTDMDLGITEAAIYRHDDLQVINSGQAMQFYNELSLPNRKIKFMSIKTPLFNKRNKIIGIFGFSQYVAEQKFDGFNLDIKQKHVFMQTIEQNSNIKTYMSKKVPVEKLTLREKQCLTSLIDGKTIKETARILEISPRTVEDYLNRLKIKTNCKYKRELIAYYRPGISL